MSVSLADSSFLKSYTPSNLPDQNQQQQKMGQYPSTQQPHYSLAVFQNQPDVLTPIDLTITGTFPSYLDEGLLYRTGPGSFSVPFDNAEGELVVNHWFDGFTQNHRFEFSCRRSPYKDGGKGPIGVKYNSRHSTDAHKARIARLGYEPSTGFAQTHPPRKIFGPNPPPAVEYVLQNTTILQDPDVSPPPSALLAAAQQLAQNRPPPADPALPTNPEEYNVGVTIQPKWPGGDASDSDFALVTRTDSNKLQRLDPVTLEPLESFTWARFDSRLNGQVTASHSQIDPETGEEFNFNLELGANATYKVFKISDKGNKVTMLAEIAGAPPCYLHSLFLTKKYVILGVWQAVYKYGGLGVALQGNIVDSLEKRWNPDLPSLFYVVDRSGKNGLVKTFKAPAHYCFHTIGAWDDESTGDVVLNYCKLDDHNVIWKFSLDNLRSLPQDFTHEAAYFAQARLPVVSNTSATSGPPTDLVFTAEGSKLNNIELPQINPGHHLKPFRYVYGIHSTNLTEMPFHGLIRYDTVTNRSLVWAPQNIIAGEPLFVRDPSSGPEASPETELNGVLLSMVYDANVNASALVAIDPNTMTQVARASMPYGVIADMGFHGAFANEFYQSLQS